MLLFVNFKVSRRWDAPVSFVQVNFFGSNSGSTRSTKSLTNSIISLSFVHTYKDKTGTLTTNEMTAVSLVMLETSDNNDISVTEHTISGVSYSPEGTVDGIEQSTEIKNNPTGAVHDIAAVSALCNDAMVVAGKDEEGSKPFERIGEPTEAALCVLTEKLGGYFDIPSMTEAQIMASVNVNKWRESHPRQATLGEFCIGNQ
jgi:hypothetical protein